jgi:predicted metal-binding membrane protein
MGRDGPSYEWDGYGGRHQVRILHFFLSVWVPMMAAMMLPGVAPSAVRIAGSSRAALDLPRYLGSYVGVWALLGVLSFTVYRPHGTAIAGAITIGAGAYEPTPMKRQFRKMCRDFSSSGLGWGCAVWVRALV